MDPELLQQLAAAGMTEDQIAALQPRLKLGEQWLQPQMAQGRNVGSTYVASSPLEHLSNAIRQIAGGALAGGAMGQQRDLLAQRQKARGDYMQALQTAQAGGQGGTLGQDGGGMAAPPDPQAAQQLGMMGAASGDPAMAGAAHFGLQQQNLQREQSILQNTLRHQQAMERMEQEKIDQGRYTPLKDMFGTATGLLEGKSGKVLPLSTGARGGQMPGLTPEARDMLAKMGAATGQVPTLGRGNAATANAMQIANQMAGMGGGSPDLASNKAGYHADSASLASQQKILDNAESWERTGKANLNVLLGIAQKLHDTGSPWLNRPVRLFAEKGVGEPGQTAFKAAHATVVNEYAKILSGAQGSSGVTDSARHEADSMLPLDATWEQLGAAAKVLDTDAGNRIGAARQQVGQIRGRISGQPQAAAPAQQSAAPAAAAPQSGRPRRTVNGETREWDGKAWVPIAQ